MNEKSKHTVSVFAFPAIYILGLLSSQTQFFGGKERDGMRHGWVLYYLGGCGQKDNDVSFLLFICVFMYVKSEFDVSKRELRTSNK